MRKDKLLSIGEALIDFAPHQIGVALKDVESFKKIVGGAPANVCGAFTKLGGKSALVTQLGDDPFGDCIVEELSGHGIDTSIILRTNKANTALAFVSLKENGDREFSFYRKPSADMLMEAECIEESWFDDAFALHFCSVDLVPCPMQDAHRRALAIAKEKGCLISFDPNLRFPLWDNLDMLRDVVKEFMPLANILKISDEELEFITGYTKIEDALDSLFTGDVKMVIYTRGSEGAEVFTKNGKAFAASRKVKALDTTGAGDVFIGSFLYQLWEKDVDLDTVDQIAEDEMEKMLLVSNRFCEYSVKGMGAIASYPTKKELEDYLNEA